MPATPVSAAMVCRLGRCAASDMPFLSSDVFPVQPQRSGMYYPVDHSPGLGVEVNEAWLEEAQAEVRALFYPLLCASVAQSTC